MSDGVIDDCPVCQGMKWVCENHPDKPWAGLMANDFVACCGGAGMPCRSCNPWRGRNDPPDDPPDFTAKGNL